MCWTPTKLKGIINNKPTLVGEECIFLNKRKLTAGLQGNSAGRLCCRCPGKSVFAEIPVALLL